MKIAIKNGPLMFCLSRSLRIIGTDTDRLASHDFLLVFIVTLNLSRAVSVINN